MAYVIGIVLALAVSVYATAMRLDRDRAFYPTVLIVVAFYYVLFAVMGGSGRAMVIESLVAGVFGSVVRLPGKPVAGRRGARRARRAGPLSRANHRESRRARLVAGVLCDL